MLGLSTFKQQDGHLPQVEVDEMPGLMGDVGPEIPTHDAMPGGVVLFVELFLNVGSNVLLNVVFFKCLKECQCSEF